MVYKAVADRNAPPFGGPVTHIVATAPTPQGPFTKHPTPIFTAGKADFSEEDPFVWYQDDAFGRLSKTWKALLPEPELR